MNLKLVHKPKQDRSKDTQEKLLTAFESLLKERFFEQITIRDIALKADLSPATIYRRFQNKEALLPILYERYDLNLQAWAHSIWRSESLDKYRDSRSRIAWVVKEHVRFYKEFAHILRTVYIYNRLHGEISLPDVEDSRRDIYLTILSPVWESLEQEAREKLTPDRARSFILIMLATINERFLFGENKPSSVLQLDENVVVDELTAALHAHLES